MNEMKTSLLAIRLEHKNTRQKVKRVHSNDIQVIKRQGTKDFAE